MVQTRKYDGKVQLLTGLSRRKQYRRYPKRAKTNHVNAGRMILDFGVFRVLVSRGKRLLPLSSVDRRISRTTTTTSTTILTTYAMSGNASFSTYLAEDASLQHYVHASSPFYHTTKPHVLDSVSDEMLSLIAPVVVYWVYSLFFHFLDSQNWSFLHKYRIHESEEVKSKNLVSRTAVVWAVLFQQVIQTALGVYWMNGVPEEIDSPLTNVSSIQNGVTLAARILLGERTATSFLQKLGPQTVWFLYWWGIPLAQLVFAM